MQKENTVKVEQEFKVTLCMGKYSSDNLQRISGYWGYDFDFDDEDH